MHSCDSFMPALATPLLTTTLDVDFWGRGGREAERRARQESGEAVLPWSREDSMCSLSLWLSLSASSETLQTLKQDQENGVAIPWFLDRFIREAGGPRSAAAALAPFQNLLSKEEKRKKRKRTRSNKSKTDGARANGKIKSNRVKVAKSAGC